jgi:imidazoleglycerol-phosphate dehydratase
MHHVLLMRTLSKFGLAGVRLGYMLGPKALIAEIDKVRPPYNISVLNYECALFAIEHADVFAVQAAELREQRGQLLEALGQLPGAQPFKSEANMILLRVPDAAKTFAGLRERKVLVKNVSKMHPLLDNCLRLTVGTARGERAAAGGTESLPMTPTARTAEVTRNTAETRITVRVNLDGTGQARLSTGIGFFDHMLDQIARHGLIDLDIQAEGDLHIDGHHTVEDVGITLGQAVAKAVGDKKGIRRYGHAYVPLDEALSRVVIDFSGRPGLVMHVPFKSGMIGTFDSQLAFEFFQGFVNHAFVTLHIDNLRGENAHHQAETVFKAFARALRAALELDPRSAGTIPSTKGSL